MSVGNLDDDFAWGTAFDEGVGGVEVCGGKALRAENWREFAGVRQGGCLREDGAVMGLILAREQGKQREDSGVGGSAEGERRERVGAPSERAHDVTGVALYSVEGGIEGRASDGVVDDVEALTSG